MTRTGRWSFIKSRYGLCLGEGFPGDMVADTSSWLRRLRWRQSSDTTCLCSLNHWALSICRLSILDLRITSAEPRAAGAWELSWMLPGWPV